MTFKLQRSTALSSFAAVAHTSSVLSAYSPPWHGLLTPAELARAHAFRSASARDDFLAAHLFVRSVASMHVGVDAANLVLIQRCEVCGEAHGRPFFRDHPRVHLSMSHSAGVVAVAVSSTPIGIDIEHWSAARNLDDLLHAGVFSPSEIALLCTQPRERAVDQHISRFQSVALRLWVRKECLVKLGMLELDELGSFDLSSLSMACESGKHTSSFNCMGLRMVDWIATSHRVTGSVACLQDVEVMVI